jgi:hypothetical protein
MTSPFSLAEILRELLRSVVFTLPIAAVWVTGALLFAPQATIEEVVLTVSMPMLLFTIAGRINGFLKPNQRPTAEGVRRLTKLYREVRFLRVIILSIISIILGFLTLVAIPLYVLLGIEWAPLFGLISSVLLVVFGVGMFIVGVTGFALLKPRFLLAIVQALRHRRRRRDDWPSALNAFFG